MDLRAYLDRIAYLGPLQTDRATLAALMQAQLTAVPFENLDQQLWRPVGADVASAYAKIVERRRGGWCFELNGLLGWALSEIGFGVDVLAGHVGENGSTRDKPANHKFLRVSIDDETPPLFVDVGFGGSLFAPLPFAAGQWEQPPYTLTLSEEDSGFMRFTEAAHGRTNAFDFRTDPVPEDYFDAINDWLQTHEDSPFRRTLTIQKRLPDRRIVLRGRVLQILTPASADESILPSREAFVSCIVDRFGLDVPEIGSVWPVMMERHAELFGETADGAPG